MNCNYSFLKQFLTLLVLMLLSINSLVRADAGVCTIDAQFVSQSETDSEAETSDESSEDEEEDEEPECD